MFYCDPCGKLNNWHRGFSRSYGKCELCERHAECSDVASSQLPPPAKKEQTVKAYLTQWCLSKGIEAVRGRVDGDTLHVEHPDEEVSYTKPHWHLTWEEAKARAEHCRLDRIRTVKRRAKSDVNKFESMKFEQPDLV